MNGAPSADVYWVVIPAYNERATVRDIAMRARTHCRNVIVVDDGSDDGTAGALDGLDVTILRNGDNIGKAGSLWNGFQHALGRGATWIITLDADGQHAPEEIPAFISASSIHPDSYVIGARRSGQRKINRWRYGANRIADFWISWAAGKPIDDSQSGFRLYPATFLRSLHIPHGKTRSFVFESEALIEAGRRGLPIRTITVDVAPRLGPSPSHFRPLVDIVRITLMVGRKLVGSGFYPAGLFRILCEGISGSRSDENVSCYEGVRPARK